MWFMPGSIEFKNDDIEWNMISVFFQDRLQKPTSTQEENTFSSLKKIARKQIPGEMRRLP